MSLQQDLNRLNEQQAEIIKSFKKPSLIVAGPGTGKTRTVSVLIGDLLNKGIRLKEILALTFSDKAANELKFRVLEYFPHSFDECWISTFHSFCARILREQYHLIGIKPDFKLLTGFKEALIMSGICKKQSPEAFSEFGKVLDKRGFQQEVLTFISLLKSNLVSEQEFKQVLEQDSSLSKRNRKRLYELHNLFKLYEQERLNAGYLDFRDLIFLSIKVLQNPAIVEQYRKKFKVILVDEFQDTDPAQFWLLSLLKGEEKNSKVAVIGDPRQSIYRFRGADPSMMTEAGPFKKNYNAKVFPLQLNYRCAPEILSTASRLKWQQKIGKQESNLTPKSEEKGFVELLEVRDDLEEAKTITRKIAALIIYGKDKKYKPSDIAILVRNNFQIDLLAESLRTLHIPFEIAGDMKFFKSEEVIALASLLKVSCLEGTERDEALQRAFSSPLFEINPLWVQGVFAALTPTFSMTEVLDAITNEDFSKIPETTEENMLKASFFTETVRILEDCAQKPLSAVFARLILALKKVLANPDTEQARNALHFRNMIADYAELFERQNGREAVVADLIPEFDEWLTYYASTLEQDQSTGNAGVKIMTVHQSKGLEFPIVVVSGLCEGQFPVNPRESLLLSSKGLNDLKSLLDSTQRPIPFFNPYPADYDDHIEEERRLFYVAMTRAKEGLILSYPRRMGTDIAMPAPFLAEIGLKPVREQHEERPLTIGEIRTILARLPEEKLEEIRPTITEAEKKIPEDYSVHGIFPRYFGSNIIDEVTLPEDFTFSASSIKNYLDCPRKFYLQNILKIQDPLASMKSFFFVGNAFHACLEKLHDPRSVWSQGKLPTDEELDEILLECAHPILESIEFFERKEKQKKIAEYLPIYRDAIFRLGQLPTQTIGVEKSFRFNFRGFKCYGRIDRFINYENGVAVIDYKTSSTAKSSEKLSNLAFPQEGWPQEIQLPFYLTACKASGYDRASAVLLYVMQDPYKKKKGFEPGWMKSAAINLGCGPEWGLPISDDQFSEFENKLEQILSEIKSDKIFDCKPSTHAEARSCLTGRPGQPGCDFIPFCQERLEQLKLVRSKS